MRFEPCGQLRDPLYALAHQRNAAARKLSLCLQKISAVRPQRRRVLRDCQSSRGPCEARKVLPALKIVVDVFRPMKIRCRHDPCVDTVCLHLISQCTQCFSHLCHLFSPFNFFSLFIFLLFFPFYFPLAPKQTPNIAMIFCHAFVMRLPCLRLCRAPIFSGRVIAPDPRLRVV